MEPETVVEPIAEKIAETVANSVAVSPVLLAVIPAAAVIVGAVVGIFGSILKDWIQRKSLMRERFFYEVYPKRIELYQETIKELQSMMKIDIEEYMDMTGIMASEKCIACLHTLTPLIARLRLFGSGNSVEALVKLRDALLGLHTSYLNVPTVGDIQNARSLCGIVEIALNAFTIVVMGESGSKFVDDVLKKSLFGKLI